MYPRIWTEHPPNISHRFLVTYSTYPQISWKSVYTLFRNVAHRQTDKHTNEQRSKHNLRHMADVVIFSGMANSVVQPVIFYNIGTTDQH